MCEHRQRNQDSPLYLQHLQGVHDDCHRDSFCNKPDYIQMKMLLMDKKTIEVYENALQSTAIYRYVYSHTAE